MSLDITADDLYSMFLYDPLTGRLFWRVSLTNRVAIGDEDAAAAYAKVASKIHKEFFSNGVRK